MGGGGTCHAMGLMAFQLRMGPQLPYRYLHYCYGPTHGVYHGTIQTYIPMLVSPSRIRCGDTHLMGLRVWVSSGCIPRLAPFRPPTGSHLQGTTTTEVGSLPVFGSLVHTNCWDTRLGCESMLPELGMSKNTCMCVSMCVKEQRSCSGEDATSHYARGVQCVCV